MKNPKTWIYIVAAIVAAMVLLHFWDDNEEECENIVKLRVIDGTRPDYIKIFIEEIRRIKQPTDEEIEDLMREFRRLNEGISRT